MLTLYVLWWWLQPESVWIMYECLNGVSGFVFGFVFLSSGWSCLHFSVDVCMNDVWMSERIHKILTNFAAWLYRLPHNDPRRVYHVAFTLDALFVKAGTMDSHIQLVQTSALLFIPCSAICLLMTLLNAYSSKRTDNRRFIGHTCTLFQLWNSVNALSPQSIRRRRPRPVSFCTAISAAISTTIPTAVSPAASTAISTALSL